MATDPTRVQAVVLEAAALTDPIVRARFLAQACDGDDELKDRVESLLRAQERADPQITLAADGVNAPAAVVEAGRAPALDNDQAVVSGSAGHSVLTEFGHTIDLPRVALREPSAERADPIVRPSSTEMPNSDSRYQLQGEIARGGMGAILKGRDTDLGRELAIKVLLDQHKDKPEVIQRFIEEAQIGGQLQHPGIVPVYELGRFADQRPFFSMKLVKGDTLAKLLADRHDAAEDRGRNLGIFAQVCQTMAFAHSRGVIHRDLKPANIMVGAFGEVQVMDWGLAKVLPAGGVADEQKARNKQQGQSIIQTLRTGVGSDASGVVGSVGSQTQMGSVLGTPAYMPPEQALGEIDNLDERADVFGLGAILCEILTGKPPYFAEDGTQVFRLASRGKLTDCFARLDDCGADAALIAIAKHCLEAEPAGRPRDAGVLAQKVTNYLESVEAKLRQAEVERAAETARAEEAQHTVRQQEAAVRAQRRVGKLLYAIAALLLVGLLTAGFAANHFRNLEATQRDLADKNQELAEEREQERNAAVGARKAAESAKAQAVKERERAEDRERATQQTLYVAEMNLAAQAAEVASGIRRVGQITRSWEPKQVARDLRGWEWFYLESLQHAYRMRLEHQWARCVAYSPDGTCLASGGRDAVMRLWNVSNGKLIAELKGHTSQVVEIAWCPDGSRIATASLDKTVRIWNAKTGGAGPTLSHPKEVHSACWSPDGLKLAARASDEVVIWNAETAQPVTRWSEPESDAIICWNPKKNQVSTCVGVYDADTGKLLWKHSGLSSQWSPDGKRLATSDRSTPKIKMWSAEDGSAIAEFSAEAASFLALSWSPSGRELAAAGRDNAVSIWDTRTGAELAVLRGHTGWINGNGLGWRPDGKQLASASDDETVIIWDWPATPNPLAIPSGQPDYPGTINWDASGTSLVVGTNKATIWDIDTRRPKITIDDARGWTPREWSPATSWNSTAHLFAARRNGSIILCDDRTGEVRHELPRVDGEARSLALSPDGAKLVVAAFRLDPGNVLVNNVHLFDTTTGRQLWVATIRNEYAGSVAWSHDGTKLASAAWVNAFVLNAADGRILKKINGQPGSGWIHGVAWSPADDRLALACMNHQVRLYDIAGGRELKTLVGHTAAVRGISWSGDGRRIATCGNDKTVRIWDPELGMQTMVFPNLKHEMVTVAWSPDGLRLAAACDKGEVHVWDAIIGYARSKALKSLTNLDEQLQADPNDVAKRHLRMRIKARLGDHAAVEEDRNFLVQAVVQSGKSNPANEELATALAQALVPADLSVTWALLDPTEMKADSGCALKRQSDGSILVGPVATPQGDSYTIRARSPLRKVGRLRLETLPDPALPAQGSGWGNNGNFCLTELRTELQRSDGKRVPLEIKVIASDYVRAVDSMTSLLHGPWSILDGNHATRWDIYPELKGPHWLEFELAEPVDVAANDLLFVQLDCRDPYYPDHRLGRFRLSVGEETDVVAKHQLLLAVRANRLAGLDALAATLIVTGETARAAKLLEDATTETTPVTRLLLRALAQRRLGNASATKATVEKLVKAFKAEAPPRVLLDVCANVVAETGVLSRAKFFALIDEQAHQRELIRLTKRIEAAPKDVAAFRDRGLLYARVGRWRQCADDYLTLAKLDPENYYSWYPAGAALVLAGDVEGYRRHCEAMRKRSEGTDAADVAHFVCKTCLLLSDTVKLSELPIPVIRTGATDPKWESYRIWYIPTNGLISYREGKPAEAIAWVKKMPSLNAVPGAIALTVRALAEHDLGKKEEAARSLAAAEALIPIELRTLGTDAYTGPVPVQQDIISPDWLFAEILRREAHAKINGKNSK